jgi:hypothetical protein
MVSPYGWDGRQRSSGYSLFRTQMLVLLESAMWRVAVLETRSGRGVISLAAAFMRPND